MAATPKPIRKEIKKSERKNRERIKKLEKTNSIAPKSERSAALKSKGHKLHKAETKYMVESEMKHRKDIAQMKKKK